MKWIRERDALIAQTLAFVESVTGRKETLLPSASGPTVDDPGAELAAVRRVEQTLEADRPPPAAAVTPPPQPIQVLPPRMTGDFRNEIQARVANFRKHQERFEREREEYCAATLAKLRPAASDIPPRPPTAK